MYYTTSLLYFTTKIIWQIKNNHLFLQSFLILAASENKKALLAGYKRMTDRNLFINLNARKE